jgi:hypothetical protein
LGRPQFRIIIQDFLDCLQAVVRTIYLAVNLLEAVET